MTPRVPLPHRIEDNSELDLSTILLIKPGMRRILAESCGLYYLRLRNASVATITL